MIAKITYSWYEGEEGERIVFHPTKNYVEFEDDLREIRESINTKHINGIRCSPTFFELTEEELIKKGYFTEYRISDIYEVDEEGRHCCIKIKNVKTSWDEI